MYRYIIRPVLFLFSPESVHHFIVIIIKIAFRLPGISTLIEKFFNVKHPGLQREFMGLKFENPVGLAAGFDKNGTFFNEFSSFGFSFIEVGTITPKGQPGNPKPRSFRLTKDRALINRMGFNNIGVQEAIKNLKRRKQGLIIGGNIGKNTLTPNEKAVEDYEYCFRELYNYVDYFVVNVSCPNITDLSELQDQDALEKILGRLVTIRKKQSVYRPVLLKISPDLNNKQLDQVIDIHFKIGIDGIVATNTTIQRNGLKTDREKVRKIGNGGLSGRPLTERSTEVIRYIHTKSDGKIPVIGVGGIMTVEDAVEKLKAGATLIQVYSGFIFNGPGFVKKINKALLEI